MILKNAWKKEEDYDSINFNLLARREESLDTQGCQSKVMMISQPWASDLK